MVTRIMKAKRGKLLAAVAVLAMVFAAFAVVSVGDDSDAATAEQKYSGVLDKKQDFLGGTNVIIDGKTTITAGGVLTVNGNLTVAEGVTLKIEKGGQLIVSGDAPKVVINGTVEIVGTDGSDGTGLYVAGSDSTDFSDSGVIVNGSMTLSGNSKMTNSIPAADGVVSYAGTTSKILVNKDATLTVKKLGANAATVENMDVCVAVGGTFVYAGKNAGGMTVSAYGSGDNIVSTLADITATTDSKSGNSNITFTVTSSSYNAYTIADEPVKKVFRDYALNVTGTLAGGESITFERNVSVEDATTSASGAAALYYMNTEAAKRANADSGDYISTEPGDVVLGKVIVDSLSIKEGSAVKNGTSLDDSTQILVNGSLTFAKTETSSSMIINYGLIVVSGEMTIDADDAYGIEAKTEFGPVFIDGGKITLRDYANHIFKFNGVAYVDADENLIMISDLQAAMDGAAAANNPEVWISGSYKSGLKTFDDGSTNEEKGRSYAGSFVIDKDITVPNGMTINVNGGVVVEDGITFTVSENSNIVGSDATIKNFDIQGKLIDKSFGVDTKFLNFEVRSTDADETQWTYCSLRTALEETTSGTITVYSNINLDADLTIPENVTVEFNNEIGYTFTVGYDDKDATLTVNGILNLGKNTLSVTSDKGEVIVNNLIRYTGEQSFAIPGAYFTADLLEDDNGGVKYIASVAIAAQNSALVETGGIEINGGITFGDVTFTAGEAGLIITVKNAYDGKDSKTLASGNITLAGATLDMTQGYYTGSVKATVTAGDSVISFEKSKGAIVGIDSEILVDGIETTMYISNDNSRYVDGIVTIKSGDVIVGNDDSLMLKMMADDITFGTEKKISVGKLIIESGATLVVPKNATLQLADPAELKNDNRSDIKLTVESLEDYIERNTTFTLNGTLNVEGIVQYGATVINGELNILEGGQMNLSIVKNNGTISIDSEAGNEVSVEIMSLIGKVAGELELDNYETYGMIVAYSGSDIAEMDLGDSVKKSEIVLNIDVAVGADVFATVFTNSDTLTFSDVMKYLAIENYDVYTEDGSEIYYADADFTTPLKTSTIGSSDIVYVKMVADDVIGKISAVSGMKVFIDNLDIENFWSKIDGKEGYYLSVGTHTVTVQVQPGYEATPVITFNGKTVTDGKIVIEAGMEDFVLTATGDVKIDDGNGGSDDGMGITDYLLIILVVMVVILAIVVIMRMMRS